ncbi:diguanylate cyclase (GGDEF)-like protein [Alteromonadaceae bacterium 2753L.S.0a.02]|nr:diguanylate cyclase (GGDEF)-like protein [Alteromonadaceae bacterium 2753L.S.0a.02]
MRMRKTTLSLAAIGVTLVLLLIHPFLPQRHLSLWPSNSYLRDLQSDGANGGASNISWIDEKRNYWICHLKKSTQYPFCLFHISLYDGDMENGLDLSEYDRIELVAHYEGDAKFVRFFVRDFDPMFSVPDNPITAKHQAVNLSSDELVGKLTIDFAELHVSDWWKSDLEVPLEKSRLDFSNVIHLGLDIVGEENLGTHELILVSLKLHGPLVPADKWYLGIIVAWMVALMILGLRQFIQMDARDLEDQQRIHQLHEANTELRKEASRYLEISTSDALTGLLNRRGIEGVLSRFYATPEQRMHTSLMVIQIDGLAGLSKSRGEAFTQPILKQIGHYLQYECPSDFRICRWSPDQFLLICPEVDQHRAELLARQYLQGIAAIKPEDDEILQLSASIGATQWAEHMSFEKAFDLADLALRQARMAGGNQYRTAAAKNQERAV